MELIQNDTLQSYGIAVSNPDLAERIVAALNGYIYHNNGLYDKNIVVYNSGSGSGFEKLVENSTAGILEANIIALITNNPDYWCVARAERLGIPWVLLNKFEAENYQAIEKIFSPDLHALSGRLKFIKGLPAEKTINIHPWPLPEFWGKGKYGHHVHEAVREKYKRGELTESAVSMHFVPFEQAYDTWPQFLRYPVSLEWVQNADEIGNRVNAMEHKLQSFITDLVIKGKIVLHPDGSVSVLGEKVTYTEKGIPMFPETYTELIQNFLEGKNVA